MTDFPSTTSLRPPSLGPAQAQSCSEALREDPQGCVEDQSPRCSLQPAGCHHPQTENDSSTDQRPSPSSRPQALLHWFVRDGNHMTLILIPEYSQRLASSPFPSFRLTFPHNLTPVSSRLTHPPLPLHSLPFPSLLPPLHSTPLGPPFKTQWFPQKVASVVELRSVHISC